MTTADSRPLLERVRRGDAGAIEGLIERHLPGLRAYVRLRCGAELRARESASDIVQSACRDVLENLDRYRWNGEAGFRAWLYATALRKIVDRAHYWNAEKRDVRREVPLAHGVLGSEAGDGSLADVYASVCSPSRDAAAREQLERLEAAFDALTDDQREVIVLARVVGLAHGEIAERLGCSPDAARQRLFRALSALSAALAAPADD
ncbi:MAG: sigma-70 family RNA polymerase sigma factor [Planctomycetota bacterium JB042]